MKKSSPRRRRPSVAEEADGGDRGDAIRPLPLSAGGMSHDAAEVASDSDLITDTAVQVIDRLRPHAAAILAIAGIAVASALAFALVSSQQEAGRAQSWEGCMAALSSGDPSAFSDVVRRYPGTDAARWAELMLADSAAAEAADLLFVDRQRAEGRLREAVEMYSSLMAARPRGLLAERTVFGLAKARECLGQLDESRRGYEAVAAEFPGDTIAKIAAGRAADLGRDATRQWYDWFATQKISPPGAAAAGGPPPADSATAPANAASQPASSGQP